MERTPRLRSAPRPSLRPSQTPPHVNRQRVVTGRKVDRVMRKTMPPQKVAKEIHYLLEEAAAFVNGGRWQGGEASPRALSKAKKLLAHYGRDIEGWRVVAEHYGFSYYSDGYFKDDEAA